MTLIPAYGRDYASEAAVLEAWNANKDFKAVSVDTRGGYTSKRELVAEGKVTEVTIRYNLRRKFVLVKVA